MISKSLLDSLNEQIKSELYSSNLYLSMSAYCDRLNLLGFAEFFRHQSEEEREHALRIFDYLLDRNESVEVRAIDMPPKDYSSLADLCEQFLNHEREVTGMINNLYHVAQMENDYATQVMLHWFIDEQVEEEKTAQTIWEQVKMAGDNNAAILLLDRQVRKMSKNEK